MHWVRGTYGDLPQRLGATLPQLGADLAVGAPIGDEREIERHQS